jgi:hypothetical protein
MYMASDGAIDSPDRGRCQFSISWLTSP